MEGEDRFGEPGMRQAVGDPGTSLCREGLFEKKSDEEIALKSVFQWVKVGKRKLFKKTDYPLDESVSSDLISLLLLEYIYKLIRQ